MSHPVSPIIGLVQAKQRHWLHVMGPMQFSVNLPKFTLEAPVNVRFPIADIRHPMV
jgi:hypothetical protein